MKEAYPVLLTKTKDTKNTILVEVPDLNIQTEGYGIADAIEMTRDAIGLEIITREDEGIDIKEPSAIEKINKDEGIFSGEGETCVTYVDVDLAEYRKKVDRRTVRRNVTLPNWLNRAADREGLNVSKVLQDALITVLQTTQNR